jgi:cellulose synthase/poly-beta-1,6-N-acetylglucosamine synthase-like glycosyltransferase
MGRALKPEDDASQENDYRDRALPDGFRDSTNSPRSPYVSVCIPTYNRAATLDRCISSVLSQTYGDFECLIVDNASTDSTREQIARFDDPRIRYIRNSVNIGVIGNHNRCLKEARGEVVQFVHSDDQLLPESLATLVPHFRNPSIGLAFAPRRIETNDDEWRRQCSYLHRPLEPLSEINDGRSIIYRYLRSNASGNWIGEPTSVMVRRKTMIEVGGFSPQVEQLNDMEAWIRVLSQSDAAWVDTELSVRWQHDDSVTAVNRHSGGAWLDAAWLAAGVAKNSEVDRELRNAARRLWVREMAKAARALALPPPALWRDRASELRRHVRYVCTTKPIPPIMDC